MIIRTSVSALNTVRANQLREQVLGRQRLIAKRGHNSWKPAAFAAYASAFLFIITIVAIGYQPPKQSSNGGVANAVATEKSDAARADAAPSVDELVATQIAAGIAERAELPIAPDIASMSTTLSIKSELAQTDNNAIVKPQIIQPSANTRDITSYTAVPGDTVDKLAAQFKVSGDTIRWANNLTSDILEPGKVLQILPVNGVLYTAKDGDTVASIAGHYNADSTMITLVNDLEGGLAAGKKIIVPNGIMPENERPGYVAPRTTTSYAYTGNVVGSYSGGSVGNRYAFGNCTYYVYDRRAAIGRPVGSFWGNAATWAIAARSSGYLVDRTPEAGAVAQWNAYSDPWIGYYGHVGVVESVNDDGTVTISEMNNYAYGGFNIVNRRTIPAGSVSNYIH